MRFIDCSCEMYIFAISNGYLWPVKEQILSSGYRYGSWLQNCPRSCGKLCSNQLQYELETLWNVKLNINKQHAIQKLSMFIFSNSIKWLLWNLIDLLCRFSVINPITVWNKAICFNCKKMHRNISPPTNVNYFSIVSRW